MHRVFRENRQEVIGIEGSRNNVPREDFVNQYRKIGTSGRLCYNSLSAALHPSDK